VYLEHFTGFSVRILTKNEILGAFLSIFESKKAKKRPFCPKNGKNV
jgi:hypothetical protein